MAVPQAEVLDGVLEGVSTWLRSWCRADSLAGNGAKSINVMMLTCHSTCAPTSDAIVPFPGSQIALSQHVEGRIFRFRPGCHLTEAPRTTRHLVSVHNDKALILSLVSSMRGAGRFHDPIAMHSMSLHPAGFMPAVWIQLSAIFPNELNPQRPPTVA